MTALAILTAVALGAGGAAPVPGEPAPARPVVTLRPHAGAGATFTFLGAAPSFTAHGGVRALLSSGPMYRYGVEVTYLALDVPERGSDQLVVGIILETILFGHFLMGIGTVGYVGASARPFGIATNLGWEPQWRSPLLPFVTVRTDFIFGSTVAIAMALSVGLTVNL